MYIPFKITSILRSNARARKFGFLGTLALTLDFLANRRGRTKNFFNKHEHEHEHDIVVSKAIEALDNLGFYSIENFFDEEQTDSFANSLRMALVNHPEMIHPATLYDKRLHGVENLDSKLQVFSKHKLLHKIAATYLRQETDVAFTLGAILSADKNNLGSGGGWHRDSTVRQFKVMVYLSDVGVNEGPFQIIEKSHHFLNCVRDNRIMNLRYGDVRINVSDIGRLLNATGHGRLHTLTGKAGTVLIFDSSAIHRGSPIKNGERLALTNYYFPCVNITSQLYQHFHPVAGRSV